MKGNRIVKQINNEVNENIYNLYHKRMLTEQSEYVYIFFSNDHYPYEIKQISFNEIEEYYDNFKERIYTIETDLDKAIEYADKIITDRLKDETDKLTSEYGLDFRLWFSLNETDDEVLDYKEYVYTGYEIGLYQERELYKTIKR